MGSPTLTMVRSFSRISSSDIFFFLTVVRGSCDGVALGVVMAAFALPTTVAVVLLVVVGDEAIGTMLVVVMLFGDAVLGAVCGDGVEARERAFWCWGLLRLLVLL